ncbi:ABC transporter substrate-binding protein [Rhodalgimonas zhirmunskyi]|uniref:ABC transporter substrate-binding protein n=1 Tax=Rhodalgimonas zhirmunskyi TaxID=2964767 RepID=A0AAJ1UD89_9RHOB|nr:ABC transporter substrate-binding protein [Rhodoalgimonas zhirmunskyi]MDQ2094022.1 ABC transporter substrate-binding protein [Rhodoalgimonas zhirmunskyi]
MTMRPVTRRATLFGAVALFSTPALLRASSSLPETLVMQAPRSGPGILMAHARAIGALDKVAGKVELSLWTTPDEMRAGFVSGKVPLTVMPSQGAASLHNKGLGLHLVSVLTDGHCGLIARDMENCSVADLRGKRVAVPSINGFTGHMMRLGLRHYGIGLDEVELIPAVTKMEGGQILLSGRADVALVPEPVGSAVLMKGKQAGQHLYRGEQMREVMGKIAGTAPSLPQASLAIRADYAAEYPGLIPALREAISAAAVDLNADPAKAAANAAPFVERKAGLLAQAIPFANLHGEPANEARPKLEALYSALLDADPGIIGGKMPGEALYGA